jgi:hypothetical protein
MTSDKEPDGDEPDTSRGPCLYLTKDQMDRAKMKGELPKPGTLMMVIGIGKVRSRNDSEDGDSDSIMIDISDLHVSAEDMDSIRADIEKAMGNDG